MLLRTGRTCEVYRGFEIFQDEVEFGILMRCAKT